jgi:hypothetical protein
LIGIAEQFVGGMENYIKCPTQRCTQGDAPKEVLICLNGINDTLTEVLEIYPK